MHFVIRRATIVMGMLSVLILVQAGTVASLPEVVAAGSPASILPVEGLSLKMALDLVQERNPLLTAAAEEVRAMEGRIQQAGLRPNPQVEVEMENLAGTGEVGGWRSVEATLRLAFPLESSLKRSSRILLAQGEKIRAEKESLVQRADLVAGTVEAFANVLTCREHWNNRKSYCRLVEQIHQTVSERVLAGKVSPIEASRSLVALQAAQLESEKAGRALESAKAGLAALWLGSGSDFKTALGTFRLPPLSLIQADQGKDKFRNSALDLASAQIELQQRNLNFEIISAKPDPQIHAGYRRLNALDGFAMVAGISIPLPWFDRRQGAVLEARHRMEKAKWERISVQNQLLSDMDQEKRRAEAAFLEANVLSQKILPSARQALDQLEEGYKQGKFDFLSVLDAQRTYNELQSQYLDAVAVAIRTVILIQRLSGSLSDPGALLYLQPDTQEVVHETNP